MLFRKERITLVKRGKSPVSIPNNGRGFIAGQTGTGKSLLSRTLIRPHKNVIVIDPKGEFEPFGEYAIVYKAKELAKAAKNPDRAVVYRPIPEEDNVDSYDRVLEWVYRRRNTFLYIDELNSVIGSSYASYPLFLRAICMQGRSMNVGCLMVSQRPSNIPLFCLSESEQQWKFFLKLRKDQIRMAEFMGNSVIEPESFPVDTVHSNFHSFYYSAMSDRANAKDYLLRIENNG